MRHIEKKNCSLDEGACAVAQILQLQLPPTVRHRVAVQEAESACRAPFLVSTHISEEKN